MLSNTRGCRNQVLLVACLCFSCQVFAQDPAQKREPEKIWTNDDLQGLAARPLTNTPAARSSEESPQTTPVEKHYVRAKDPKWYVSQLKPLQTQIDDIDSQLRRLRQARKDGRGTVGAVALDQDAEGVTTDAQIQILEQRRKRLLLQIDALEDQSRRNGLDPGDVRSDNSEETPGRTSVNSAVSSSDTAASGEEDSKIAETENSIEREMEHLQRAKNEKDILQRNLYLLRRQVTSNPEYLTRHIGSTKLTSAENEIRDKDEEIQTAQQRLADLQEHLEDQKLNRRTNTASETNTVGHDATTASKANEEKNEAYWRKTFSELHYKIHTAQTELDLLQRELNVSLIQYDPNPAKAMRESITRRQINEHRKKIEAKKAEIRQLQQQESDLEDELRHSGGNPGWSRE
jgi:hypothetical protein